LDWMCIPTAKNLKHARRSAARLRAAEACLPCKLIKQKCDDRRPCSRCKRNGREEKCIASLESDLDSPNLAVASIERPVRSQSQPMFVGPEISPDTDGIALKYDWSQKTVMRYWASGYSSHQLSRIFNSIPNPLASLMNAVFCSLNHLEPISDVAGSSVDSPDDGADPAISTLVPTDEASFWDSEDVYGFLEITFDPLSAKRQSIYMNARYASIYGFHREEMLARFARHDADIQMTDVDQLLIIIDGIQHALDDKKMGSVERYYRIHSGPNKTPVLIWTIWSKLIGRKKSFLKVCGSFVVRLKFSKFPSGQYDCQGYNSG